MLLKIISVQKVRSERTKMTFLKNTKKVRFMRAFVHIDIKVSRTFCKKLIKNKFKIYKNIKRGYQNDTLQTNKHKQQTT